jgi:tryptophan synthase beta chain
VGSTLMSHLERVDLPVERIPERWYNVLPDLPRMPEEYLDATSGQPLSDEESARLFAPALVAQERSLERWVEIPEPVRDAYKMWRPTPLFRAVGLERHLGTPAEIYFKYEGSGPAGSHKLNSALAQAYYAKRDGIKRLVTDTGAGQWGQAIALSCARFELDLMVYMIRASYEQKPYRRILMETYGAQVRPSPGMDTEFGRQLLAEAPDHPGSEGTAVSESMEAVLADPGSRMAVGAFSNYCLMHQTVIGLETREQLELIDREPDFLIASVGCGSNMGGFVNPWIPEKLAGRDITFLAAEPAACPTLTRGVYGWDFPDSSASGPKVLSYSLRGAALSRLRAADRAFASRGANRRGRATAVGDIRGGEADGSGAWLSAVSGGRTCFEGRDRCRAAVQGGRPKGGHRLLLQRPGLPRSRRVRRLQQRATRGRRTGPLADAG